MSTNTQGDRSFPRLPGQRTLSIVFSEHVPLSISLKALFSHSSMTLDNPLETPMIWFLKLETFGPVLRMMGQKEDADIGTVLWIVGFILFVPFLLFIANHFRSRARRQMAKERGLEQLEKLCLQKDLDPIEQGAARRLAASARLKNAANLLSSVDVFDHAVAIRARELQTRPWLEMEAEIERLASLREKLGFRYLPPDRSPSSTRQLRQDQKLFVLADHEGRFELLATAVVDLDDLAIHATPFQRRGKRIDLKKHQDIWAFFWAENGREYRFRTEILKGIERPSPYLLLQHGDRLFQDKDGELFATELQAECTCLHLPKAHARSNPTLELFKEERGAAESLSVELTALKGTGFHAVCEQEMGTGDLILLGKNTEQLKSLDGLIGKVFETQGHTFRCNWAGIDDDRREAALALIAAQLDVETVQKKFTEQ